jgi:hypothetical protein
MSKSEKHRESVGAYPQGRSVQVITQLVNPSAIVKGRSEHILQWLKRRELETLVKSSRKTESTQSGTFAELAAGRA